MYYDNPEAYDADYAEFTAARAALEEREREEDARIAVLESQIETLRSLVVPVTALAAHSAMIARAAAELAELR